jgi:hypothetical protein
VTNAYGVRIEAGVGGGTITTNIGLQIDQQSLGGTNWQIYSTSGNVYFGACILHTDTTTGLSVAGSGEKLGFYGVTPIARASSTGWTTIAQVITGLKNLGLVS